MSRCPLCGAEHDTSGLGPGQKVLCTVCDGRFVITEDGDLDSFAPPAPDSEETKALEPVSAPVDAGAEVPTGTQEEKETPVDGKEEARPKESPGPTTSFPAGPAGTAPLILPEGEPLTFAGTDAQGIDSDKKETEPGAGPEPDGVPPAGKESPEGITHAGSALEQDAGGVAGGPNVESETEETAGLELPATLSLAGLDRPGPVESDEAARPEMVVGPAEPAMGPDQAVLQDVSAEPARPRKKERIIAKLLREVPPVETKVRPKRPGICPSCSRELDGDAPLCNHCGRYVPSLEELGPASQGSWKRLIAQGVLEPVRGKAFLDGLILSVLAGTAVFVAAILVHSMAGSVHAGGALVALRLILTVIVFLVSAFLVGHFSVRLRHVMCGGVIAEVPLSGAYAFPALEACRSTLLFLLFWGGPPLLLGLLLAPGNTLNALARLPSPQGLVQVLDPWSDGGVGARFLGRIIQGICLAVVAITFPMSLATYASGEKFRASLHPRAWLRLRSLTSFEFLPGLAAVAGLLWVILPLGLILLCATVGISADKAVGPVVGIQWVPGVVSLWFLIVMGIFFAQYCAWASGSILGRAWRRRIREFSKPEPVIRAVKSEGRTILSIVGAVLLANLVTFGVILPVSLKIWGGATIHRLLLGKVGEAKTSAESKETEPREKKTFRAGDRRLD